MTTEQFSQLQSDIFAECEKYGAVSPLLIAGMQQVLEANGLINTATPVYEDDLLIWRHADQSGKRLHGFSKITGAVLYYLDKYPLDTCSWELYRTNGQYAGRSHFENAMQVMMKDAAKDWRRRRERIAELLMDVKSQDPETLRVVEGILTLSGV